MRIQAHTLPRDDPVLQAEKFRARIPKAISRISSTGEFFDTAFNTAMANVGAQLLVDSEAMSINSWEAVVPASQIGSTIFAAATAEPGDSVECRINHEVHTFSSIGSAYL